MMEKELEKLAEIEYPTIKGNESSNKIAGFERSAYIKGYQKCQQEAKIVEGMKMDEKQANKGVCKDCYYAGSFTCEH